MHLDARRFAEALAHELPEAADVQAMRDACRMTAVSSSSPVSLDQVLDTSAILLLRPEQTVRVARAMGPLLLECVARALSAARAAVGSAAFGTSNTSPASSMETSSTGIHSAAAAAAAVPVSSFAERSEGVFVALSRLLPSAPHALPLALQHWRSSPCPFDFLTTIAATPTAKASSSEGSSNSSSRGSSSTDNGGAHSCGEATERVLNRVRAVAEAAQRLLLCSSTSPSVSGLWNWSPFFDLCRHPDALVRWRAVGVCASLLGLDEQGRRKLEEAAGVVEPSARKPGSGPAPSSTEKGSALEVATAGGDGEAEVIMKARVDLYEDLRRAPSVLLPPPGPKSSSALASASPSQPEHNSDGCGGAGHGACSEKNRDPKSVAVGGPAESSVDGGSYRRHPSVADIGGILFPKTARATCSGGRIGTTQGRRHHGGGGAGGSARLVPTSSARKNLSSLSLALAVDRPILLYGPAGSGKSLLVREAARLVSCPHSEGTSPEHHDQPPPSLLELHLDDQTDSKSLLGAHACTDIPGEFAWRPGALTRAAAAGTWVLIEDIDRAPFEVLAAIGPLLEGRPLMLPGRTRPLEAAPGFRIFGTVTTVGAGRVVLGGAADFGALWTHVPVQPLSDTETLHVAKARHPKLPTPALQRLLSTMVAAKGSGGSGKSREGFGLPSRSAAGREPGVRDMLKLCARVESLGVFDQASEEQDPMITTEGDDEAAEPLHHNDGWFCSEAQALPVVVESLDVFASHLTNKESLATAAEVVAGLWNVLPARAVELATTCRPEFVQSDSYLKIGRVTLPRLPAMTGGSIASSGFAPTSHALRLMETVAASTRACEPVLLVGETGCGKTALVQRLAEGTGRDLVVQNLSLQTDGADLLGGYRPVELRQLAQDVLEEFLRLFPQLFSASQNARFCQAVTSSFERKQWSRLSKGLRNAANMGMEKLDRSNKEDTHGDSPSHLRSRELTGNKAFRASGVGGATSPSGQRREWEQFSTNVARFERQRMSVEGSFAFSFVEGVLVKAVREGKWVLLDEINLASAETLQRLSGLLEGSKGSLCLTERGDVEPVPRHKDFRLFAAMNPPTDASKKDLPPALRRRFSEVYVPELEDRLDLKQVVDGYISGMAVEHDSLAFTAVDLYLWARGLASESLNDGAGQRPRYSLRTLVGAVSSARRLAGRGFGPSRAMVEGFRGSFETQLDGDGRAKILKGILRAFGKGMTAKDLDRPPRRPGGRGSTSAPWVRIGPFWLEGGPLDPVDAAELDPITKQRSFVLTPSVEGTLRCLSRAVASSDSPVLLQGPTSAGKTSIVQYLAARLGHRCVRINNHEHTDIQEYTGSYAADGNGKLTFQEGVLVESLRKGYWIILDELNLAPSEVLEALNRLLDHNRELYLSETQVTVKPHPNFRLFATQNPPGAYGGRKPLSRAFRNRFMEVHVDDIPGPEWEIILQERCGLPPSQCKLLVKVLHELQAQRQSSRLFLGKHGAISPRDLLRWAGRKPQGKQEVADEGYMLLAERLRSDEEKLAMKKVLEQQIGVEINPTALYSGVRPSGEGAITSETAVAHETRADQADLGGSSQLAEVEAMLDRGEGLEAGLEGIAMTMHMRRLFRLSGRCLSHSEPLLLVGATGCGKTTVCQLYSMLLHRRMHIVNCHQNTEAADLLGGLRPLRGREQLVQDFRDRAESFIQSCMDSCGDADAADTDGPAVAKKTVDVTALLSAVQAAWIKLTVREDRKRSAASTENTPVLTHKRPKPSNSSRHADREREESVCSPVDDNQVDIGKAASSPPRAASGKKARARKKKNKHTTSPPKERQSRVEDSRESLEVDPIATTASVSGTDRGAGRPAVCAKTSRDELETEFVALKALAVRTKGLFEWVDGPLVTAMRNGEILLLDELSLAEDAVLERLNSVLEPGRSITLAEKGGEGAVGGQGTAEIVVAAPGFRVVATMNPGGDFGKRELSPALRSRFTEVWVPALADREDMEGVVKKALHFASRDGNQHGCDLSNMAGSMLDFAWWFNSSASSSTGTGHRLALSVRDLIAWAGFMTSSVSSSSASASPLPMNPASPSGATCSTSGLRPWEAYVHGAALVLLDGLGLGAGLSPISVDRLRKACARMLKDQIPRCPERDSAVAQLERDSGSQLDEIPNITFQFWDKALDDSATSVQDEKDLSGGCDTRLFGVPPFFTPLGPQNAAGADMERLDFSVQAPTTSKNLFRVLRALQVRKAVLLEGSPGVGKTSLVAALAAATGHELVRINLSEQTDVSDLFGSDLPVPDNDEAELSEGQSEQGAGGAARFAWRDGVFLSALKAGKWVLLDELNLATQSVLEGLNACLDHRAEVYVPELGRAFHCPSTFKVFAAQNPLGEGGGRKGLPRSFLSRFTKVFVDPLRSGDLHFIAANKFPSLSAASTGKPSSQAQDGRLGLGVGKQPLIPGPAPLEPSLLCRMILFNSAVQRDTMESKIYGRRGAPWEFNLRDVFRWCELMIREQQPPVRGSGRRGDSLMKELPVVWEPWRLVDTLYLQRMRSKADREAVLERFKEFFPEACTSELEEDLDPSLPHRVVEATACGKIGAFPVLKVNPEWLQVGPTVISRSGWADDGSRVARGVGQVDPRMPLHVALRRPLQALARCVAMGWPALVVGRRGSGKTSIIQGLAAGVGARLTEVSITPSVDVTELLGCYEQVDARWSQEALLDGLEALSERTCGLLLTWEEGSRLAASVSNGLCALRRMWRGPLRAGTGHEREDSPSACPDQLMAAVDHLLSTVEAGLRFAEKQDEAAEVAMGPSRMSTMESLRRQAGAAAALAESVRSVAGSVRDGKGAHVSGPGGKKPSSSCFRWRDGVLVEALQRGDWIVLDGANLCSASVLDRLNPLLEPRGVLPLTECGTSEDSLQDGQESVLQSGVSHRVIRPHRNFRLFLTADPSCGEVSRAMRNRCVEVSLLDPPAAVALATGQQSFATSTRTCAPTDSSGRSSVGASSVRAVAKMEHVVDLLSLLSAAGLSDPVEATAMVAVHSALIARRTRGKDNASSGSPPSRALLMWAKLVVASRARRVLSDENPHSVLLSSMRVAYPELESGVGSSAELRVAKTTLSTYLSSCGESPVEPSLWDYLDGLLPCSWHETVRDTRLCGVSQEVRLLKALSFVAATASSRTGCDGLGFMSLLLDDVCGMDVPTDQLRAPTSDCSWYAAGEVGACTEVMRKVLSSAASIVARRASVGDGMLRSFIASRPVSSKAPSVLSTEAEIVAMGIGVNEAVPGMMKMWSRFPGVEAASLMFAELMNNASTQFCRSRGAIGSLEQAVAVASSSWSPLDLRLNTDLFHSLHTGFGTSSGWGPWMMLADLVESFVGRRLVTISAEEEELEEAKGRMSLGPAGEHGLSWLGLSWLVSEGGFSLCKGSAGRTGGCPETRLARSSLVPFFLPLLRAVDSLIGGLLCRRMVELVFADGEQVEARLSLTEGIKKVLEARDTLSKVLLGANCLSKAKVGTAASVKARSEPPIFDWDVFLVSWEWLKQAVDALRSRLTRFSGLGDVNVGESSALATFSAIAARVDAAVLQHAGGAVHTMNTLWKHGPRAVAPSTAAGAAALARLGRVAEKFRPWSGVSRASLEVPAYLTLGSLMSEAHPILALSVDARREVLHALCMLQWTASNEQGRVSLGRQPQLEVKTADGAFTPGLNGSFNAQEGESNAKLADMQKSLPRAMEHLVESSRSRFASAFQGVRFVAGDGQGHAPEDGQYGSGSGEKFDEFDTEAAQAVANATLVVVAGNSAGSRREASPTEIGDGSPRRQEALGGSVLQDFAIAQLSAMFEQWVAAEELSILSMLASIDVGNVVVRLDVAAGKPPISGDSRMRSGEFSSLKARLVRLRSVLLATPSLSPLVSRPFQTLLWAWEDGGPGSTVSDGLLKCLLPVVLESFGRRLWEDSVGNPGMFSMKLAPPEMVPQSENGKVEGEQGRCSSGLALSGGPVQLVTLARSSFLLKLLATHAFRGTYVPGIGRGDDAADLTLMNSPARLSQFRAASRGVRDLGFGGARAGRALEPLVKLSWTRLCRVLCTFDEARGRPTRSHGSTSDLTSFATALLLGKPAPSWEEVEGPLRSALECCQDEQLTSLADKLVVPSVRQLSCAAEGVGRSTKIDACENEEGNVGLGMVLLGCLELELLLPSSPVDPGLRPALKKQLLDERLQDIKAETTAHRWIRRLEGCDDLNPQMVPLVRQARTLRDQCDKHDRDAIKRPDDRKDFLSLFRDVHAFAKGVGNHDRVTALAWFLSRCIGCAGADEGNKDHQDEVKGGSGAESDGAAVLLQKEVVWQEAAGAFVCRFREVYGDAYRDVVTGICSAVQTMRLGLRMLAWACSSVYLRKHGSISEHPLVKLQGMLLSFPYTCREGLTGGRGNDGEDGQLLESLKAAVGSDGLAQVDTLADSSGGMSGARHVAVVQAVMSRAELLLSSGCSDEPAMDVAMLATDSVVAAWSRVEAEEAERRRKEAEILKYKTQEHTVESEEAKSLAKLRALFPDYHSSYRDLMVDATTPDKDGAGDASSAEDEDTAHDRINDRVKALGNMSEKQLSAIVAWHSRIFLSVAARRRRAVWSFLTLTTTPSGARDARDLVSSTYGSRRTEADAERLVASSYSYRASCLLVGPSSRLPSCVALGSPTGTDTEEGEHHGVLHMEEAFAASHLLALADAACVCKSGKSLLQSLAFEADRVSTGSGEGAAQLKSRKGKGKAARGTSKPVLVGDRAVGRSLEHVPRILNFQLDPNVAETRLADGPLVAVLRRVSGLLEEFPGHGVLIQLARVADRVRRLPVYSPLAAVLAGVELTLRKAQDWEQHAHRGVSLKDELKSLSALVVRWRAVELESWPQLLDAREDAFVSKANRWWLHLHRLLTGEWSADLEAPDPAGGKVLSLASASTALKPDASASRLPQGGSPVQNSTGVIDWPRLRTFSPQWLWLGLVPEDATQRGPADGHEEVEGFDDASLNHARGLFQSLDDFLRTSSVGEFFARLQMVRAFSVQMRVSTERQSGGARALSSVLQGLWLFYGQFSEEVMNARSLVRQGIEKKLKEEAKLAKWDEQTYYSLAESSEKSHRKLAKLVSQYDEVLEVSVSEVLHRAFIAGVGERQEGATPSNPTAPCTEIPAVGVMFSIVQKVDSPADFVDETGDEEETEPESTGNSKKTDAEKSSSKPKRLTSKSSPSSRTGTSLEVLDACLPVEPRNASMTSLSAVSGHVGSGSGGVGEDVPSWLRLALFPGGSVNERFPSVDGTATKLPLISRVVPLAHRMRSLLLRGVYGRRRLGHRAGVADGPMWAGGDVPVGFLGAGLAEELCLAVFGRIEGLRAKGVAKQVKKRAVLDLLGGMRRQGLVYSKSKTPVEASDMLNVVALAQPFGEDRLAGVDIPWLLSNRDGCRLLPKDDETVAAQLLRKAEQYYLRGLSEISRLRLEAGAPVSRDITRREAEVMRGLAEHLGLLVLQQRSTVAALEFDLVRLAKELRAVQSFTSTQRQPSTSPESDGTRPPSTGCCQRSLPPQAPLRSALEAQRLGLLRGLEAVREIELLLKSMAESDPPAPSSPSTSRETRARRARGGEGWGEAPADAIAFVQLQAAVTALSVDLSDMLGCLGDYPDAVLTRSDESKCGLAGANKVAPLLPPEAARAVVETRAGLKACALRAKYLSEEYGGLLPPAVLMRVSGHLMDVHVRVGSMLDGSSVMRLWLSVDDALGGLRDGGGDGASQVQSTVDGAEYLRQQQAAAEHASKVGGRLAEAVEAMLLMVQSLCARPSQRKAVDSAASVTNDGMDGSKLGAGRDVVDDIEEEENEGDSVGSGGVTLMEAHSMAFKQAKQLRLWRCAASLASARACLKEFSEDEACFDAGLEESAKAEASTALMQLCSDVVVLAEQVLSAGKAVLVGLVALNKGTAKFHYVVLRVFRTLLSKGLCSDETDDGEGEGDGNIDGMKFDEDVEGTGMGEGEGKKDVTDQIEDEEQLLGLKGDEPDKDQADQAKELGEDEQDKGMEMENDFEGDMFDLPKGDDGDENKEDDGDDKEELDREMGDLGDTADVVDEKLWDEEDDEDEDASGQGEEKFEEGSRLDGGKPEEDEIRTKEEGRDAGDEGDKGGDDPEGKSKGEEGDEDGKEDNGGGDGADSKAAADEEDGEGDGAEGDEGDGPINDDLEENYEEKPKGVEVRGEEEAMEVDEEGREGEGQEGDGGDSDANEDMPDDLNLDNDQEAEGSAGEGEEGADGEDGEGEAEDEGNQKEGFESLAPEDGEEAAEDLKEDEDQPQGSGHQGSADVDMPEETGDDGDKEDPGSEGEQDEDDGKLGETEEEGRTKGEDEPPAFGVEGGGGDPSVLEAAEEKGDERPAEDEDDDGVGEDHDDNNEQQDGREGGSSAPDGRDDGSGGGQGQKGSGGEWRPDTSGGEGNGEGQGHDKRRRPDAPNPFRDPGDAMRHWHRRLDMLEDKAKEGDTNQGGDTDVKKEGDDDVAEDGGDGKFEYVTSQEKGSSQVLGGVSEEQAAEASHQARDAEAAEGEDAVEEGEADVDHEDDGAAGGGPEAMDEEQQTLSRGDEEKDQSLQHDSADKMEASRKSGKQRAKDGHREDEEDEAEKAEDDDQDEESSTPEAEKDNLDLDSLEESPSGAGGNPEGDIIVNLAAVGDEDPDLGAPRGRETKLREELQALAEGLHRRKREIAADEYGVGGFEGSRELWGKLRSVTGALSQRLCEQLRLVLEPMVATKLQGDYRSGKRINMRRVIPYIASGFRKDKIWLRRTKPAKRDYQILMAIDDSESMADCGAGALALAAMTTVASGLTQLEAGQLAVARFGENLELLHGFGEAFTEDAGARVVDGFTFEQRRTNTAHTLEGVVSLLDEARDKFSVSSSGVGAKGTPRQLVLLLSDGRFDRENKDRLRKLVREMNERGQLLVLIVLDREGESSILKTREASYKNGKLVLSSYLDKYPFPLYILLNHIEALPETLADALRQWFELMQRQNSS